MRCLAALAAILVVATNPSAAAARHPWTDPGHLRIGVVRTLDNLAGPTRENGGISADGKRSFTICGRTCASRTASR